jgi:hypothetical protein
MLGSGRFENFFIFSWRGMKGLSVAMEFGGWISWPYYPRQIGRIQVLPVGK